ncbi:hypothetical protein SISNIDRAFT_44601 [Sistotremastrum niveocremeum HHB9708]|uniref:PRTase-like protein n=1 Tax=Sistotremastrum niveocremeum HHB9708 TaxID=1314777 RepID=A0A164VTP6_9AGAM|nr:hypothetical protein SISNIDRAFT_44601 [Sistotremastrum niveocremeum HHB9708]
MPEEPPHLRPTYNEIHELIGAASVRIAAEFKPDMIIAIGGGGFFPARVLRTFLTHPTTKRNIPIQAIGLSLYESLPDTTAEQVGSEVIRTQWLGPESKVLLGRRALIVTLHYAVAELQKDVERALEELPEAEREAARTKFAIFVVHNKLKAKDGDLPADIPYYAGAEVEDLWLDYPWETRDIREHDRLAALDREAKQT